MVYTRFKNPEAFYLLIFVVVLVIIYHFFHRSSKKGYLYSNTKYLKELASPWLQKAVHIPFFMLLVALIFFIIALARPQKIETSKEITTYGVDIVIAWDVSTSMKAIDFKPKNRFVVSKEVIKEFIKKRKNDRVGLVVFAGEAFTKCPLTFDKKLVEQMVGQVQMDVLKDGTAIGDALGLSIKRLQKSRAKSKIIILVTDGDNNSGIVDPEIAADIAKKEHIRIYTVGVGKKGGGLVPIKTPLGTQYAKTGDINDQLLASIAEKSGAVYRRAANKKELEDIYDFINKNEKSDIKVKEYKNIDEIFYKYLLIGVIFTVLGLMLTIKYQRVE